MIVLINKVRNKIYEILAPIVMFIFRLFPIKNNKIVVFCHNGKGYGDSAKYIVEELLKENNKYDIVWALKRNEYIPKEVRKVDIFSLKCLYELSTAKVWINNLRFMPYIRKRKGQFYIQTWHSSLRLKKIEMDAKDSITKYYLRQMKNDSKMIDLFTCGCEFSYKTYKRAFLYDGKIEMTGTPRCDIFFNPDRMNALKNVIISKYKLNPEKKVLLYAPTFRENKNCNEIYMDLKYIQKELGDKYNILVRTHPNKKVDYIIDESLGVINVTNYPDMQDLLCSIDVLVTDYSGSCFDMMIANKRCVLFLKDKDEYLSKERDVYFSIEDLPFEKALNEQELVKILNKDYIDDKYLEEINNFKHKVGLYEDGHSSKKIKEIIDNVIGEDNNEKI